MKQLLKLTKLESAHISVLHTYVLIRNSEIINYILNKTNIQAIP